MSLPLTTLAHALEYCDIVTTTNSVSEVTVETKRMMSRIIAGVSQRIEQFCQRTMQVTQKVELLATGPHGRFLFAEAPYIRDVLSLEYDPMGTFTSGFSTLDEGNDFAISPDRYQINITVAWPIMYSAPARPFRLTYLGGVAYSTDTAIYAGTVTDTLTAGTYAQDDGRQIIIKAWDGTAKRVTFSADFGTFAPGDVLVCGAATLTLGAVIQDSITNDHPILETAALMQVAYEWERRKTAGRNSSTMGNGVTNYQGEYFLLKEVEDRINNYQLFKVGY
jgi:hypothetical protein